MLKIDLIGQVLIIGGLLLATAFEPEAFVIGGLLSAFCLGCWQFFNGLIEAIYFQNKARQKYIFAAIAYVVGFGIFTVSNDFFTVEIGRFMEISMMIYFIGGCLGFAGWYFYQTYKDLSNNEAQNPRSFWDYEF